MKTKLLCLLFALMAAVTVGTDVANRASAGQGLTFMNTKGEIQADLEAAASEYESLTGVKINVIAVGGGTSPLANISQMYSAGSPPTMAMLDTTDVVQIAEEKALDLSEEKWVPEAGKLAYRIQNRRHDDENGKVYSFPMGAETPGLIYNKSAIEKTLGRPFEPEQYQSTGKLKELLEALRAGGMENPVVISKEDWSLGAHYLGHLYSDQSTDPGRVDAYIEQLKAGAVDVENDPIYNGLLDTLDLLKEYNVNRASPLAAVYEEDPSYLAEGESAFWFNGTWAWPNVKDFLDKGDTQEFGIMPLPVSNNGADDVNRFFTGVGSKQVMIDRVYTTPEQQRQAKDFLNWLAFDREGQTVMVQKLNLVPVMQNIAIEPVDDLGKSLKRYLNEEKTVFGPMVPADHWTVLGGQMQEYLAGRINRADLAAHIEKYWVGKAGK